VRSEFGKGVRFVIRLPLSLAISRALLMSVGEETYAVPIGGVQGIGRVPAADLARLAASDEPSYEYGGERYDVRYVGTLLGIPVPDSFEARNLPVILTAYTEGLGGAERRVALVCDQLQGNREIVSKQVGPQVGAIDGMAGATIMPDGEVVLILDLAGLLRAAAQRATLQPIAAPVDAEPERGVDALTVMVVDDSITMRRVAERLLTRNGYGVVTAKDGMDAMAQLQGERPDVMLLDIEMPRVDGFEVATYVRNTAELADLPIIMITSRSGDKHRERAARIGVNRYLIKPYQEAQLLSEIESVLGEMQEAGHG
ncbi:MAG: response regulator, partial [Abyssibacter sp.]